MTSNSNGESNKDAAASNPAETNESISFASILAGVERMRNQYKEPVEVNSTLNNDQSTEVRSNTDTNATDSVEPIQAVPRKKIPLTSRPPREPVPAPSKNVRSTTATTRVLAPQDILVSKSQTGNPLLKDSMMKMVPWKFDETILSDYYINATFQIIFLSLKYHKLRPEYIWQRLKKMNKGSSATGTSGDDRVLRVLLAVVDIDSHQEILRKLLDFCIKHDLSLVLAWSFEEAGNYIALAKQLDNSPMKTTQSIRGIRGTDYNSSVIEALTEIRLVNKTDVSNLLANCKSVKNIVQQSCSSDSKLGDISGLGATKLNSMKRIFTEPFIYNKHYKPLEEEQADEALGDR